MNPPAVKSASVEPAADEAACALGGACPAERTLEVIGGRWKVPIVWHLFPAAKRFSELRRALPGVTPKMLTQQLRELERDGVVTRTVFPEVPPHVEYALTPRGKSLEPVVEAMCQWGVGAGPGASREHVGEGAGGGAVGDGAAGASGLPTQ